MIIDCHFHYDPELFTLEKLVEGMNRAGIDKTVLMTKLCGPIHEPAEIVTKLMRYSLNRPWMRPLIKKAITQFTVNGDVKLPTGIIEILRKPDNTPVFEALSVYPDRFLGWCMVNPEGPENPCDEYARWMDHPGCVGVKAHPFWHRYPLSRLLPVSEMIARKKAILILHLGFDDHGDILTLADAFPELKIILAHAAFPCYGDTWRKIRHFRNVRVDLSATSYVDRKIMVQAAEALGVDRCLFGTDGPFGSHGTHGFDHGIIKRDIETVFTDPVVLQKILGENFLEWISS